MTKEEERINRLVSTIRDTEISDEHKDYREIFYDACSDIMCEFDTDVAIAVFEKLGLDHHARCIKVHYGY